MVTRWMVGAALLFAAGTATAGDIYTCKGANGVNSYQNTPCPTPKAQLQHSQYDSRMSRAPAPPPVRATTYSDVQRSSGQLPAPTLPAAPAPQAASAPEGYHCAAGRKTWIQFTPCPSSYTRQVSVDVDGTTTSGQSVSGTAWVPQQVPVQQQALDHETLCAQVQAGGNVGGNSSASRSYERNKVKRNLCGG